MFGRDAYLQKHDYEMTTTWKNDHIQHHDSFKLSYAPVLQLVSGSFLFSPAKAQGTYLQRGPQKPCAQAD